MFNFNKQNRINDEVLDYKDKRKNLQDLSTSQSQDDRPGRKSPELDLTPDDLKEDFEIHTLPNKYQAEPTDDSWMSFGENEQEEISEILGNEFQDYQESNDELPKLEENIEEFNESPKEQKEIITSEGKYDVYEDYENNGKEKPKAPTYNKTFVSRQFDAFLKEKHPDLYKFKKELEQKGFAKGEKFHLTKETNAYLTFWHKVFSEENMSKFSTWKKTKGKK